MGDLIAYFTNGTSARFQSVENFNDNGTKVRFRYFGITTKMSGDAEFDKGNIAGYTFAK